MPRYVAIEGLRGWLAWTVVAAHIVLFAGLETWHPLGWFVFRAGPWAVIVFVMISGFVITHLLIEKPEPYGAYIVRRFFRLFPAFVVASALGAAGVAWAAAAAPHAPLATSPGYGFAAQLIRWRAGWFAEAPANVAAHLTLLHGLFPRSEYAFLPPGWSVSLEWQYYLVAPLALAIVMRRPAWSAAALLVVAALWGASVGHRYASPSALPAMGFYFVIGSMSRLWLDAARPLPALGLIAVGLPFLLRSLDVLPIGVWGAFLVFLASGADESGRRSRLLRLAFESPLARYMGERSYSVYLLHFPVLWALFALAAPHMQSRWQFAALLVVAAPAPIIVLSELSYRLVERPGMALGRRLARRLAERRAAAPATVEAPA